MKVLGICGSPRVGGNSDVALESALEGAKTTGARTEKIILNQLKIVPCQECEKFKDDGGCFIKDDFYGLYEKIKDSDVVILSSPVFFGSLSAQTKIMIDRFQCTWRAKYILGVDLFHKKRKGGFISVASSERQDFFDNAKSIVKNWFATIDCLYKDELFLTGLDYKNDIFKFPDYLDKARRMGRGLVG
ncbi:MAG: flavodoxin family protein [Candidatus Omnitrophica bacterium]|nr:flavodoxin family protein [Candidatus Omnitrophota bacterium]